MSAGRMFGFRQLAVAASLTVAVAAVPAGMAGADGEANDDITEPVTVFVPVQVCSDQSTETEDRPAARCEFLNSVIGDQRDQGNGFLTGVGNGILSHNGNDQGNDQGNNNFVGSDG